MLKATAPVILLRKLKITHKFKRIQTCSNMNFNIFLFAAVTLAISSVEGNCPSEELQGRNSI